MSEICWISLETLTDYRGNQMEEYLDKQKSMSLERNDKITDEFFFFGFTAGSNILRIKGTVWISLDILSIYPGYKCSQYFFKCFLCWSSLLLPDTEHSCKVCCRSKNGTCSPYSNGGNFLFLRKGKPCTVGFCDEGVSYQTFILLCSAIKKPADPIIFLYFWTTVVLTKLCQRYNILEILFLFQCQLCFRS